MALTTANPAVAVTSLARQNVGSPSAPGSNNITHEFLYRTAHTRAQVEAAGYFNAARGRLNIGSVIDVVYGVGGTMGKATYLVTAVAPGDDVAIASGAAAGGVSGGQAAPAPLTGAFGATGNAIVDVGAAFAQGTLNNNFRALEDKINALITTLHNAGVTT